MISSWETKLWKASNVKGLKKKKNPRAILMRRTLWEMASRMTSKKKRRQELMSPLALLAWGHSALISRQGSSSWSSLVAEKKKSATSFRGVKLRPADPPKYAGGNKDVIKDWLAMMVQWLGSGMCVPKQTVGLAQTFLTGEAASL
jgi:hypothetical protein